MRLSPLNTKLARDLWRLKGQVTAIAAVVGAGIALLVATYGCMASLSLSQQAFYDRYRFADVFASVKRAPEPVGDRLRQIPGIANLETRVVAEVTLDVPGMSEPATGRLISIPEGRRPLLNDVVLRSGRLVAPGRTAEVLVTEAFAAAHGFTPGSTLAATIKGKKRRLEIVGTVLSPEYVYSLTAGQLMPDDRRFGVLWMGHEALAAAFDLEGAFNSVTASLLHGAVEQDVLMRMDEILKPYGGVGAYGRKDQVSHFFLSNELAQLKSSGAIAPPIFLLVAAFLLNIVITRLVTTEREQIGLFKAFGYSDVEVGWHYLKLVLAVAGLGLILGLVGGVWLGRAMTEMYLAYFKFPALQYEIDPQVMVVASGVALLAGFVGGIGAVLKAARLAPAAAMAPPMPTTFRQTKLVALADRFRISQPTRMIFRHLTRWPVRTGMTISGIAFSVALMVASLFFIDSVERVIDVYFFQAERQSLTVSFVEPRAAVVEQEIAALPGVVSTQPVRSVAVRLRHGPRTKRTSINGMITAGDLNRVLDVDTRPIAPPAGGLAISHHIANELGLKLGDTVTVEVMQERRPVREMPVTLIVEEYLGFAAYMSIDGVNRLMNEGPTVTATHVLADTKDVDALYRRLKETPAVAGIAQTATSLAAFRKTMAETMYVIIGFYVAFSGMIAFGVAYNSARIAFSERARALASLRVLGFSSGEVAYILLGELALQTLIALPVGCLFGYTLARAMAPMLQTEMYNFPFVIGDGTFGLAMLVATVSGLMCALIVWRRVYRLDLVSVLKTRE
jgi:putative ABC transport system permease protein